MSPDLVECRSEVEYPEKPVALTWQDQRLEVEIILARWRSPQGKHFRVRTTDGRAFELVYQISTDAWQIQPA